MTESPLRICVCVATRARPVMLRQTLKSLHSQAFAPGTSISVRIVVIDNDANGSARTAVAEFAAVSPIPVCYEVEPRPGIAAARNRAVAAAGDVDYIAFIDDDEQASPTWLASLIATQVAYDADIVIGPVIPSIEGGVAPWLAQSGLFDGMRYTTGATPRWGHTGNAFISRRLLDRVEGPFNERLGLTGGSDTHLFERLKPICRNFVWCDEARVMEFVPRSRANVRWLLRRHFRLGNSAVLLDRELPSPSLRIAKRALEGGVFACAGITLLIPLTLLGRDKLMRALCAIARGVGIMSGLIGYRYEEYRKIHGH